MSLIEGDVFLKQYAVGSKSEHEAVMIRTPEGEEILLRRTGGNPFYDEELRALAGLCIRGSGQRIETAFTLDEWEIVG